MTSVSIADFSEKAYLDYAMYVILDRALPHIGDGLKPVQRRIIYAMSELGLKATSKYKKSARTVGDVLGKYHPHGDSACYEAMVLMAQNFSYRYPLIDGQGNWGVQDDPKSFAAMRYTEARMTQYANLLLAELGQGTTDWIPNFDGTLQEPARLPAQVPNILLNGASGIAVGMATDIPPHNLTEVLNACIHLLDQPKATLADITKLIPAPDFPTGAQIITSPADIRDIYQKGNGTIRLRAVYEVESSVDIIVTALPHQTSGAKILEQIAAQMQAKKLPQVVDLCDASDHENPTRMVITLRSNRVEVEKVMAHLFATTDLEKTVRINLNMIGLDGRPQVKDLREILKEWLQYRTETVRKRLQYRLDKIIMRLHILDGLLIAYLNIDEVIAIVRNAQDPKAELMAQFDLSAEQADAILDMKLRHLAKLEEIKIKGEQKELADERDSLEKTLSSEKRMKTLIQKELTAIRDAQGDPRKSQLVQGFAATAMQLEERVSSDPMTVVLSQKGWVRAAKGHEVDGSQLNYKAGDALRMQLPCKSQQTIVFFDDTGRAYTTAVHTLPSARGQGEPLSSRFNLPAGAQFVGMCVGDPEDYFLLATNAGYGFVTQFQDLLSKARAGKAVLKATEPAKMLSPQAIQDIAKDSIATVSSAGRLLCFPVTALPQLVRGKGNKIMNIPKARFTAGEESVFAYAVLGPQEGLTVHAGKRHTVIKGKDLKHYEGQRATRGMKLPRGYQRVTALISP